MPRVKADSASTMLDTGLSLALGLAQPKTKQSQPRLNLPPGVMERKDSEYGKAMLLDLGRRSWDTQWL